MFKIILVLWFLRFFINLFTNNFTFKYLYKRYLKSLERYNVTKSGDIDSIEEDGKIEITLKGFRIIVVGIYKILMLIIGLIMMLTMVKYDPTLITKIFILLNITYIIVSMIKAKFAKKKDDNLIESTRKTIYDIERFSFYKLICRLINVLYWGYAIYLLFF